MALSFGSVIFLLYLCCMEGKNEMEQLDFEYKEHLKASKVINDKILKHLHSKYDNKLLSYETFDDFLCDINGYAGDTFGKLLYINHAKNVIEP